MKLPGMLAVICAFLAIGIDRLKSIREKIECTETLISGLTVLRSELAARLCPLRELLCAAAATAGGEAAAFFRLAADSLDKPGEEAFSERWVALCRTELPELAELPRGELEKLGQSLGRFDLDDQLAACDRTLSSLTCYQKEAARRFPEQRRLTLTVCGSAACFLCLLIL